MSHLEKAALIPGKLVNRLVLAQHHIRPYSTRSSISKVSQQYFESILVVAISRLVCKRPVEHPRPL